ncbi:hypothetical protein KKA00_09545 [bacterium]|nr:hypothetical protein [bacterium]MBU1652453.1 hypothetical protein [bacterium]MBU1882501.1 hypothetical protein [bacterium]
MKRIEFENHQDLRIALELLERYSIDFTWDMYDTRHLIHLGHVNFDHVKYALQSCRVPYKIVDY